MIKTSEEFEELNKNKIVTFEFLKKDKQIMAKWKLGARYIKGFAEFKNGSSNDELELYELVDYTPSVRIKYEGYTVYDCTMHLKNIKTDEVIIVDNDDRYGYFALFDKKREENIFSTYEQFKSQIDVLEKFIDILNSDSTKEIKC